MAEYDSSIKLARRLLHRKGREVILIEPIKTFFESDKPWRGPSDGTDPNGLDHGPTDEDAGTVSASTRMAKGVFRDYKTQEIDGTHILSTDMMLTIPVADLSNVIITEDQLKSFKILTDGARKYRIINFSMVKPGEQIIVYRLQLRI